MKETNFIPQWGREGWAVDVSQEGNPEPQPAPQPLPVITGCLPAARSPRAEGPEEGGEWASGPSQHRPAHPTAAGVGSELQPPTSNPAPTARDGPEKKPSSFNRAPSKPHNVQDRLDPGSTNAHSLDSQLKSLWSREGPRVPSGPSWSPWRTLLLILTILTRPRTQSLDLFSFLYSLSPLLISPTLSLFIC